MLKIERIELSGFKSFCDATEVSFPDGITAVVGPNGCGKSNIGDAINWVLGEQSARMLRGSNMQDVIFSGSEARKATGMAEVTLHLKEWTPGGDQDKRVAITRRLFRDGDSEYLLNGSRSRLRDIQDLLREERVGAQTYATIEQGRIDQILNAKPKERRLIIEEAAGVAGFKHKRRLAELKLEATQANLLRVQDILSEVTRQINSLKRQAAKARRYRRLRDELRRCEGVRFALRLTALDAELRRLRAREAESKAAEAQAAATLAGSESLLVEQRDVLQTLERSARDLSDSLHGLRLDVDRAESTIRQCGEKIAESEQAIRQIDADVEAGRRRLESLLEEAAGQETVFEAGARGLAEMTERLEVRQAEATEAESKSTAVRGAVDLARKGLFDSVNRLADLRNRARGLQEGRDRMLAQRVRLLSESDAAAMEAESAVRTEATLGQESEALRESIEGLRQALEVAEAELSRSRANAQEALRAAVAAKEQERAAATNLRTLEDVSTRFAGVSDGVRAVLGAGRQEGVRALGVVADFVEAHPEFERAAEAYLQSVLPAVIVEDDEDACRGAELLRREGAGRTLFLSSTQPSGAMAVGIASNGRLPVPEEISADSRVVGRLKDRIRLRSGDGFVSERIGDAVLVDSLESALALHRRHAACDYLTPSGEVVYASGLVAAGGRSVGDQGLLAHNRKIQEARAALKESERRARESDAELEKAREREARSQGAVDAARKELEEANRKAVDVAHRADRTRDDRERLARRLDVLVEEIRGCEVELDGLSGEAAEVGSLLEEAERSHGESESALAQASSELEERIGLARAAMEEAAALRADVAGLRQRQESLARDRERTSHAVSELESRLRTLAEQRDAASARAADATERRSQAEMSLAEQIESLREGENNAAEATAEIEGLRESVTRLDQNLRETRQALESRREASKAAELDRVRGEGERSYLEELCSQELGVSLQEAAKGAEEALGAEPPPDLETTEEEAADLKSRLEKLGPVNLTAIEEFQELEEREAFLSSQKKDLEDSIESLRESIRKINRSSRERFGAAFEAIRSHYQEIFRVLFHGGRADLVLEEGEDILECGIEMIAQPPGKRLGSVSLLSGGEKSMAAIALLFAIFRYRPSPFCLLDEVDAALDDTNVNRFTRMLREYAQSTQFILITHNKRSMESADLLYGVTMEEPGISRLVSLQL